MDPDTGLVLTCQVRGHLIQAGADLSGLDLSDTNLSRCDLHGASLAGSNLRRGELQLADLAGANLAGACLIGANLQNCNLGAADLRNTDLTGANLAFTNLTGARLEGARLFKAVINLAIGLNPSGAQPHPFFQDDPEARLGDLRFLDFGEDDRRGEGSPHDLTPSPSGHLFWLRGEQPLIRFMAISGSVSSITPHSDNTRIFSLHLDSAGRLWSVGDRTTGFNPLKDLGGAESIHGLDYFFGEIPIASRPKLIKAAAGANLYLSWPGSMTRLDLTSNEIFSYLSMDWLNIARKTGAFGLPCESGGRQVMATSLPCGFQVCAGTEANPSSIRVKLPKGCIPQFMAEGPDHKIWFTAKGLNGVGWMDPETCQKALLRCPEDLASLCREPHHLAFAKDGAVWFTSPQGHALGRCTADGRFRLFALPPDCQPEEIATGFDGRMYFTLAGKLRLGSIWSLPGADPGEGGAGALPGPASAAAASALGPERKEAWEAPAYRPRPDRPKGLSQAQRSKAHELRLTAAQARFEALQEEEEDEETPGASRPQDSHLPAALGPGSTAAGEHQEEVSSLAAGPDPLERLEDLDVNLTTGAIRHILAAHGAWAPAHKSTFHPAFQTRAGLTSLLATGLEQAGEIARTRARVVDSEGRYLTLCRARHLVGSYRSHGHAVPSHSFLVVTSRWLGADGHAEHDVLTAYPVSDHW